MHGWDEFDAALFQCSTDILREAFRGALRAERARDSRRSHRSLLAWGRKYLPEHFRQPPSRMHRWLAKRLDTLSIRRGQKLNVVGPRGGAKSTIGTLAFVLRAALEGAESYIWIISDTKHQAVGHLENIKAELRENGRIAADFPDLAGRGEVWRDNAVLLGQRRYHRGLRLRSTHSRAATSGPSSHADRLR